MQYRKFTEVMVKKFKTIPVIRSSPFLFFLRTNNHDFPSFTSYNFAFVVEHVFVCCKRFIWIKWVFEFFFFFHSGMFACMWECVCLVILLVLSVHCSHWHSNYIYFEVLRAHANIKLQSESNEKKTSSTDLQIEPERTWMKLE